jgi:hypothetical protein
MCGKRLWRSIRPPIPVFSIREFHWFGKTTFIFRPPFGSQNARRYSYVGVLPVLRHVDCFENSVSVQADKDGPSYRNGSALNYRLEPHRHLGPYPKSLRYHQGRQAPFPVTVWGRELLVSASLSHSKSPYHTSHWAGIHNRKLVCVNLGLVL